MTTALQQNSLQHLARTLDDLSSTDRQLRYKAEVPFVHVPRELIAQWDDHARLAREVPWFRELFTSEELAAIEEFREAVDAAWPKGDGPNDVPEILSESWWLALSRHAERLSRFLAPKLPQARY